MQNILSSKIKEEVQRQFDYSVELLAKLIEIPSLSGKEGRVAEILVDFFREANIPAVIDERGSVLSAINLPEMPANKEIDPENLKIAIKKSVADGKKLLAFNGHMDVVPAADLQNWNYPPFELSRSGDRFVGRGTCDMKGAVAAIAFAMKLVSGNVSMKNTDTVVAGCFCPEEEVAEGLAFKELIEWLEVKPDWVVLGEPSQLDIARGQRGKLEFRITTNGKKAHTSVPEVGENATYHMARALLAVEEFERKQQEKYGLGDENVLKRTTLVATNVSSLPEEKNFVPDLARIFLTARLAKNASFASVKKELEKSKFWPGNAKLERVFYEGKSYRGKKSEWFSEHPAWETKEENPFLLKTCEFYREFFGREPQIKIWPFSTDGVFSAGMAGIPTLGFGPGRESTAHQPDEWILKKDFQDSIGFYAYLMAGLN